MEQKKKKDMDVTQSWFVWWRELTDLGLGAYSPLHRTLNCTATLCGELIREPDEKAERVHVGIRVTKREPKHHALEICAKCRRKAVVKKPESKAA